MIRNKTIKFNLDKEEDRELWEWLSSLPHGHFSEEAKNHFREKMKRHKDPRVGKSEFKKQLDELDIKRKEMWESFIPDMN